MTRSRTIITWLLAFSLGLNVMFVGMGLAGISLPTKPKAPVPEGQKWSYTNLFPVDDPELKLTDAQKKKLAEVRRQIDIEELRLNGQTADRVERWYKYLLNDQITTVSLQPYVVEMCYGTNDLMLRLVHSLEYHRAVLTPEQNKILNARLENKFKELQGFSQKRLTNTKKCMTEKYGEPFVRSIAGPTSGTLERKK